MVATRSKKYSTPTRKAKRTFTVDKRQQHKEKGSESKVGQEENCEVAVAVKNKPRFLTADKCKPEDVLLHCPWMCTWVKPLPEEWRKYVETSPNTNYVDYLKESNRPSTLLKTTNAYKRTVQHLWECGRKHNKSRIDWPSYFNRTWKGKDLKTTKIDTATMATMTSPLHRKNDNAGESRHMTVDKCNAGDTVMKCPNLQCSYVKVLPKDLVGEVDTKVEGQLLVVKTEKEARSSVRKTSQWKRMRLHALGCAAEDSIPTFLKERGSTVCDERS
jgi:hypothetical protein